MAKNDQGVKLQGLLRRNSQRKKYKIRYGRAKSNLPHKVIKTTSGTLRKR